MILGAGPGLDLTDSGWQSFFESVIRPGVTIYKPCRDKCGECRECGEAAVAAENYSKKGVKPDGAKNVIYIGF